MSFELILGFALGILSAFTSEYFLHLFKTTFYDRNIMRKKYKAFLGNYVHENGIVEIVHLTGNYFQAKGIENNGVTWISNLHYLENSVFTGVYDWKPTSNLNDWGEHLLHVLPNGDISVIWINKSIDNENKGRLIWKKSVSEQ